MKEFNFDDIDIIDDIDTKSAPINNENNVEEVNANDVFGVDVNNVTPSINETKTEIKEEPLYKKFNFDIDIKEESNNEVASELNNEIVNEPSNETLIMNNSIDSSSVVEQPNNNLEEKIEESNLDEIDKPLFASNTDEIDNPFVTKPVNTEPEVTEEEQIENMYKEANAAITPVITDGQNIEEQVKEDALEEAISHTTRFSPFAKEKPEIAEIETEDKEPNEKSTRIFLVVLFAILVIAIFVIPKIASLI